LTSGTLTPFVAVEAELGQEFKVKLENPHIINKTNYLPIILRNGPNKKLLNFSKSHRESEKNNLYIELGETLINIFNKIPSIDILPQ